MKLSNSVILEGDFNFMARVAWYSCLKAISMFFSGSPRSVVLIPSEEEE